MPDEWKERVGAVHLARVASAAECGWVVAEAERHAGWYTCMPTEYPTNDVVVAEAPALRRWLNDKLRSSIWPLLAEQFGMAPDEFWLQDAFILKYDAHGKDRLVTHTDDSELSFNMLLSHPRDFGGGGTSFEAAAKTIWPCQGEMLSHFGRVRHAGEPTTEGTRYVLVGFVRARPLAVAWREVGKEEEPPKAEE